MRAVSRRGERGQAMVEYALILVPLFLMVMGVFDLGRGVLYSNALANAAREGARAGIVATRTPDEICSVAFRAARALPVAPMAACGTRGGLTVSVPQRGTKGDPGDPVRVTMRFEFRLLTPLIGAIVSDPEGRVVLNASSSMYVEN
jgi:hypothetical protein